MVNARQRLDGRGDAASAEYASSKWTSSAAANQLNAGGYPAARLCLPVTRDMPTGAVLY
jgi:hypothetical protein